MSQASPLIGDLPLADLQALAQNGDLLLHTGPFRIRLRSDDQQVIATLQSLYRFHQLADPSKLPDVTLSLLRPLGLRRWWRPQIVLHADAQTPFEPFPLDHAFPLFEWSLNWLLAMQAHQFLMLHSAVIEKDGLALVMPALPGSGKSTLCAALMLRGWRLLSDEFGLIRASDDHTRLHPLPRPIPLKNQSIEVIRQFSEEAILGPTYPKTRKGDVAHLMASRDSQQRADQTAIPGWFLFPAFQPAKPMRFEQLGKGTAFLKISSNCFNYKLQGARGFRAIASIVNRCPAYFLQYSDLDRAIDEIEQTHQSLALKHPASVTPAVQ